MKQQRVRHNWATFTFNKSVTREATLNEVVKAGISEGMTYELKTGNTKEMVERGHEGQMLEGMKGLGVFEG